MNKMIGRLKNIDKSILHIIKKGVKLSIAICLFGMLILFMYNKHPISHIICESGLLIFRTGLTYAVGFFICGVAVDTLKKESGA